ncbi:tyrosine phosphatase family-domain-containing protein [Lasiosphaeria ovina]|uniref:diphosphoinositol-polyphosphate diphosphatase n=1 Tax=Lasiosphaeria ovina TaxID=92902 RepID=A0AAE0MYB6_9PEZI|nr:tyrosine phosphatase family-domain-containing protein [Lasiosphaeria ovina]
MTVDGMAVDGQAVSKRSAVRASVEDEYGADKNTPERQSPRSSKYEEEMDETTGRNTPTSRQQSDNTSSQNGQLSITLDLFRGTADGADDYAGYTSPQQHDATIPLDGRPINFGVVVPGVYRSSFPQTEDHLFLKGLKLKTIITLVQKDFPQGYEAFMCANGIKHHVVDMKGTKKEEIPIATMKTILGLVLGRENHPLLVHCNHGRHRTGCVVGVIRKASGWDLTEVLDEYKQYAEPKIRECDVTYITRFEPAALTDL